MSSEKITVEEMKRNYEKLLNDIKDHMKDMDGKYNEQLESMEKLFSRKEDLLKMKLQELNIKLRKLSLKEISYLEELLKSEVIYQKSYQKVKEIVEKISKEIKNF